MRILYIGSEDAYAVRRLRQEAQKRRIVFSVLHPRDIELATTRHTPSADVLVIRSHAPQWVGHILTLARLFHSAEKPVIDLALATEPIIYSKFNDLLVLKERGVAVPKTMLVPSRTGALEMMRRHFTLPTVIKGVRGSEGKKVFQVKTLREAQGILRRFSEGDLMLQEYIRASFDYRVLIMGYRALPRLLRRYPKRGDFRTNARWVARIDVLPTRMLPKIKRIAERAARTLKREFTGVDIRCKGSRPLVLEVNRQPEFALFEQKTGLNVAGMFLEYIATVAQ